MIWLAVSSSCPCCGGAAGSVCVLYGAGVGGRYGCGDGYVASLGWL